MGLAPGTTIGHYDVTALIGEGGMHKAVRPTFVAFASRDQEARS